MRTAGEAECAECLTGRLGLAAMVVQAQEQPATPKVPLILHARVREASPP